MASDREALILKMIVCPHDNRTGGNDYILCHDCGLQWDYRRWPDWSAGARNMLTELVRESLAAARVQAFEEASEIARNTVGIFTLGADEMRRKIVDALRARATVGDTP